jgi:hypothetical protein
VALALPNLTRLECNMCAQLRSLELRCPLLLALTFQSTPVTRHMLDALPPANPSLRELDLQYNWSLASDIQELSHESLAHVKIAFKPQRTSSYESDDSDADSD